MGSERMIIQLPAPLKARLDALRKEGYTASGYIRALLQQDLDERDAVRRSGDHVVRPRKATRKGR